MGVSAYHELLRKAPVSEDPELNEMVNRVGKRIAAAANKPEYHWEFAIIRDDRTINAFALPGGKVAVFTGILKVTKNEDGLATVIGHEVAHALQRHGAERYSRSILETIGQVGALGSRRCYRTSGCGDGRDERVWRRSLLAVRTKTGIRSRLHWTEIDGAGRL